MSRSTITQLDKIASLLQSRGLTKYASAVDEVTNLLEEAETIVEQTQGTITRKHLDDPCFAVIADILKDKVHHNDDSVIIKDLGHFHVDGKASVLHMLSLVKGILKKGKELHDGDVEFLKEVQEASAL